MTFKKSFLSRLFGEKTENEESQKEEASHPPAEGSAPLPSEQEPDPFVLRLPVDHPLKELWRLYAPKGGSLPLLRFDIPPGKPEKVSEDIDPSGFLPAATPAELIPEGDIPKELSRLEHMLTETAKKRLARIRRIQEAEEEPDAQNAPPSDLDAEIVVFVTSNLLTAWLMVFPPYGSGRALDAAMLEDTLRKFKIGFGGEDTLNSLLSAPKPYFQLTLMARGRPPLHGKDGYIIDMFPRENKPHIVENDLGDVNHMELDLFRNVEEGAVICRIIPPTSYRAGRSVYNQTIPARRGHAANVPQGRNTQLSEDGQTLIASRTGHVEFNGQSFQIKPVLEIRENVDFSTGNLNFVGDVHIHGDVCSGFTVRAMGSITVDGVIEGCTIEAGGDLMVKKGVQGNNQAILHAHRNIYAKYLENSVVYTRERLQAECLINCSIYSDGVVEIKTGRGTIIGGRTYAAEKISANILGANSGCKTAIFLGGRPCEAFERETLLIERQELEKEQEKVEAQPESPAKHKRLSKLRLQIAANKMKLQQFDKELAKAEEESKEKPCCQLECGTLYPGTEITIESASLHVEHETRNCVAMLVDGEVHLINH